MLRILCIFFVRPKSVFMAREVITICVGQCGIQLGETVWNQYNTEHSISHDGNRIEHKQEDDNLSTFYQQLASSSNHQHYLPRNLMIDLEPETLDQLQSSNLSKLFPAVYSIAHKESSGGTYARGHRIGKQVIAQINDTLRLLVEDCDNVAALNIYHAVGGGTGSGLTALISETLATEYAKKCRVSFDVYPFNNHYSTCHAEEYNALLSTHSLLCHANASYVFDNRKLFDLCRYKLFLANPGYFHLNNIMAKIASSITAALRFTLNEDLTENLEALFLAQPYFPRLHFLITALSPLINPHVADKNKQMLVDGFVRRTCCAKSDATTNAKNEAQDIPDWKPGDSLLLLQQELEQLPGSSLMLRHQEEFGWNGVMTRESMIQRIVDNYDNLGDRARRKNEKMRQNYFAFEVPPPLYQDIMNMLYAAFDVSCNVNASPSAQELLENVLGFDYFSVQCEDYDDVAQHKFMDYALNYRANEGRRKMCATLNYVRSMGRYRHLRVDWYPSWNRIDAQRRFPSSMLENDCIASGKRSVQLTGSHSVISRFFANRITKPCQQMMQRKAFYHWFTGEGMEERELAEAWESVTLLENDYLQVLVEPDFTTDEDSDD